MSGRGSPQVRGRSVVDFNDFKLRREPAKPGTYLLEAGGAFYHVPEVGVKAISLLKRGLRVDDVRNELQKEYGLYHVASFVRFLCRRGFVKSVDGKRASTAAKLATKGLFKQFLEPLLGTITPGSASALHSNAAYLLYSLIIGGGLAIVLSEGVQISYRDFIFTESLVEYAFFSVGVTWLLVVLHELGHYIAGVSRGIKPTLGLTHRLNYVIAYTDLTELYLVHPKQRVRAYLAGMLVDVLVASAALWLAWSFAFVPGLAFGQVAIPLLKFVVLVTLFSIFWQGLVFLRTDLYYVLESIFGIEFLHERSKAYVLALLEWLFGSRARPREQHGKLLLGYYLLLALGTAANVGVFVLYEIPIALLVMARVSNGLDTGFLPALDALVFLLFFAINFILLSNSFFSTVGSGKWSHRFAQLKAFLQPPFNFHWKHHFANVGPAQRDGELTRK